jgi:hypothetical protein
MNRQIARWEIPAPNGWPSDQLHLGVGCGRLHGERQLTCSRAGHVGLAVGLPLITQPGSEARFLTLATIDLLSPRRADGGPQECFGAGACPSPSATTTRRPYACCCDVASASERQLEPIRSRTAAGACRAARHVLASANFLRGDENTGVQSRQFRSGLRAALQVASSAGWANHERYIEGFSVLSQAHRAEATSRTAGARPASPPPGA